MNTKYEARSLPSNPPATHAQSEIANVMHQYHLAITRLNQTPQKLADESPKQMIDDDDERSQAIIDESKHRLQMAQAHVNELYKQFELEYDGFSKSVDDVRKKIALIRAATE